MKPLLRVVVIVDALMLLAFGLLFVLTPWASLYDALQLVQPQPALVGQAFGVVLIGFAWLAVRAAFDGALTATVGKVAGHVNWIAGVLMLVWLIGLHTPRISGFGQLVAGAVGAWLIVLGLGGARLSGAVRKRERAQALDARRSERQAANEAPRREPVVTYAAPVYPADQSRQPHQPVGTAPVAAPAAPPPPTGDAAPGRTSPSDARNAARDEAAGVSRPPFHG